MKVGTLTRNINKKKKNEYTNKAKSHYRHENEKIARKIDKEIIVTRGF